MTVGIDGDGGVRDLVVGSGRSGGRRCRDRDARGTLVVLVSLDLLVGHARVDVSLAVGDGDDVGEHERVGAGVLPVLDGVADVVARAPDGVEGRRGRGHGERAASRVEAAVVEALEHLQEVLGELALDRGIGDGDVAAIDGHSGTRGPAGEGVAGATNVGAAGERDDLARKIALGEVDAGGVPAALGRVERQRKLGSDEVEVEHRGAVGLDDALGDGADFVLRLVVERVPDTMLEEAIALGSRLSVPPVVGGLVRVSVDVAGAIGDALVDGLGLAQLRHRAVSRDRPANDPEVDVVARLVVQVEHGGIGGVASQVSVDALCIDAREAGATEREDRAIGLDDIT